MKKQKNIYILRLEMNERRFLIDLLINCWTDFHPDLREVTDRILKKLDFEEFRKKR